MNKLTNAFNKISLLVTLIMIICITIFNGIAYGATYNGITILLFLCMIINPIRNLCSLNKKYINNIIYHILLIVLSIEISIISLKSIRMYYDNYNIDFGNSATLYFGDKLLYMLIGIIIIDLLSLFMKKNTKVVKKDNSKKMFLVLAITSFLPFMNDTTLLSTVISISLSIFSIVMIFKLNDLNTISELKKIYFVLAALCLFTSNIIGLVLLIYMYIQLDIFGLNI